jgi:predicted ester cyclase
VAGLIEDIGAEPVDAGPLTCARFLEPFGMLMIGIGYRQGRGDQVAVSFGQRTPEDGEAPASLARRLIVEHLGAGDERVADALLDPEVVVHPVGSSRPLRGAGAYKQLVADLRTAVPDLRVRVEDLIAFGERVALSWEGTGAHRGALLGTAPTGKEVTVEELALQRWRGGRLIESRVGIGLRDDQERSA